MVQFAAAKFAAWVESRPAAAAHAAVSMFGVVVVKSVSDAKTFVGRTTLPSSRNPTDVLNSVKSKSTA